MSNIDDLELQKEIFALLTMAGDLDKEQQEALLASADPVVAREVRAMLQEFNDETEFLPTNKPAAPAILDLDLPGDEAAGPLEEGTLLDKYRIVEPIGAGGMGQVYLAEQEYPVHRKVAIKVLALSLAFPEIRARFADEQHAMERLDHPNVGKILDDGAPFIVMELIDGLPISSFCDESGFDVEQRLRLFIDVCHGVGHAHRRFLLHRDIKPSNVLVTEIDGKTIPKLIDFGIAKTLDASVAAGLTRAQAIGTPGYMSPEALAASPDLDARSDIFSLGILLYKLLTGHLPWLHDYSSFAAHIKERIEVDPGKPSARLKALESAELKSVALLRRQTPSGLIKRIRGDLDWIVLKTLEAKPEDRYGSVDDLILDIERHLDNRPITARPPSPTYRLRKAFDRNPSVVISAVVVILTVMLGLLGTGIGFFQAREEARQALVARNEAHQVSELLVGLFRAARPGESTARLTADELLDRAAASLDRELKDQPERRALLQKTLGEIYREWGEHEDAEQRLTTARRLSPDDPLEPSETDDLTALAEVWAEQGRYNEALRLVRRAVTEAETDEQRGHALALSAEIQAQLGDHNEAKTSLTEAIAAWRRAGVDAEILAHAYFQLGSVYLSPPDTDARDSDKQVFNTESYTRAAVQFEQAVTLLEKSDETQDSAYALSRAYLHLGFTYLQLGRSAEAKELLKQAVELEAQLSQSERARDDRRRLRRLRLEGLIEGP